MTMWCSTVGFIITFALSLLVAPRAAEAQQAGKVWRISFLTLRPGEDIAKKILLERLHELGYIEGKHVTCEYRSAEGHAERLPQLAMELVRANPDVLITGFGTLAAQAAQAATSTIPVVFMNVGAPVGSGLVASLGRPGGNVTGLTDQARDLQGKRLQLLRELLPGAQVIAVLMNPETPFNALAMQELKTATEARDVRLEFLEVRTADQVSGTFEAAIKAGAAGMLVLNDPFTYIIRQEMADLSVKFRLPTMHGYREYAEAGGLMSYGPNLLQRSRRAAEYVEKILQGAKPADLPVEQPMKFELVLNLKMAQALGITFPPTLLFQADEVIQ
jgi:putative ABC transport system substrate-binding protein